MSDSKDGKPDGQGEVRAISRTFHRPEDIYAYLAEKLGPQGEANRDKYGRDHHGKCFTMWMSGGGIKPGLVYGETDDFSYNIVQDPLHVHDLNATLLHCLGIDHERLTYRFQGRDYRLTDVAGQVVHAVVEPEATTYAPMSMTIAMAIIATSTFDR